MKKKIGISSIIIIVLIGIGIGMYSSTASKVEKTLTPDEVTGLIQSQYPGMITKLELVQDNKQATYHIEIENDDVTYDLQLDAYSGAIRKLIEKRTPKVGTNETEDETIIVTEKDDQIENIQEDMPIDETKKPDVKKTAIDPQRAIEIALDEFPGKVEDIELEDDDGRLIYEIEIEAGEKEAEFEIDAMTGEIIVIKIDD